VCSGQEAYTALMASTAELHLESARTFQMSKGLRGAVVGEIERAVDLIKELLPYPHCNHAFGSIHLEALTPGIPFFVFAGGP